MESVIQDNPRTKLVLVGPAVNRRYQCRVEREVRALKLGRNVILAGHREDVARFYWMADAFILPSLWEGWNLALSEAAWAGLPLAATDVGGARELLKPLGGRLIKPPFASLTDLDHTNIGRVVRGDDAGFQARLTFELRLLTETCGRRCVSDSVKSMLDLEQVHDAHAQLYRWLIQGGSARVRGHGHSSRCREDGRKARRPRRRGRTLTPGPPGRDRPIARTRPRSTSRIQRRS